MIPTDADPLHCPCNPQGSGQRTRELMSGAFCSVLISPRHHTLLRKSKQAANWSLPNKRKLPQQHVDAWPVHEEL